jgi:RNA polymerase sigma-70 factor (ECF subfamily)
VGSLVQFDTLIERSMHDSSHTGELMQALYGELRALAASYLSSQRPDHTLQPTALVHEAYVRLLGQRPQGWTGRLHFFSVAAMAMRQILVNHATAKQSQKRGQGFERVSLSEATPASADREVDVLSLNSVLEELDQLSPRQARIVEMRYFAGLSVEEIAGALNVSSSTVEKDWRMARVWLLKRLDT